MAEADPQLTTAMPIAEFAIDTPDALDARLRDSRQPFVVRGLVADWPLVCAGKESATTAREYLLQRRRDVPFTVSVGEPGRVQDQGVWGLPELGGSVVGTGEEQPKPHLVPRAGTPLDFSQQALECFAGSGTLRPPSPGHRG